MMTPSSSSNERLDRLVGQKRFATRKGRGYSSLVRSLRILLPLSALALLVLAVIWPQLDLHKGMPIADLPISLDDVNSQEVRMIDARVVGTDDNGQPFRLWAEEAQQLDGMLNRVLLTKPQAELKTEDGVTLHLSADAGEYTRADEQIVFRGNVVLVHSLGYRLETSLATVDIPNTRAFGNQPVSGTGPNGMLSGSGFEVLDKGKTVKVIGRSKLVLDQLPGKER